jgi:glycosyltransferase involved in cell wall biosynthesis
VKGSELVSIVIPTRDRWQLLSRRALPSALAQEGVDFEAVVVDDGSTDGTATRLRALDDARIRVVENSRPGRVARARNAGIQAARGAWCAFLDDDDAWRPDKLRIQLEALHASGADFAYGGVVGVDEHGVPLYVTPAPPAADLRREIRAQCVIPAGPSNVVARTSVLVDLGGFDDRFVNLEDWDLWIRLADVARGVAVPETLVAYLEHGEGKSLTRPSEAFAELDELERKHEALGVGGRLHVDRPAFAHYVAWLQLRRRRRVAAASVYVRSAITNRRARDLVPAAGFAMRGLVPVRRSLLGSDSTEIVKPAWLDLYR